MASKPKAEHQARSLQEAMKILQQSMPDIRERYKVKSLGIFGSYIRGEEKKSSDLDLLVEFSDAPSLLKFIALEDELSEKIGIKVDLVMKSALKPNIGRRILAEVIPV
ncbi:MAG TPA: nucleotidyltransferase family protein [Methanothrix sp.]|nr:nucleotidyltransferase family protein [Methanothrix sp.]HPT18441.1 nucleotidyltransferase family protein [Methanothrix sp.]